MGVARVKRDQHAAAVKSVASGEETERLVPLSLASALRLAQSWAVSQGAMSAAQGAIAAAKAAAAQHEATMAALLDALDIDHSAMDVELRVDKGVLVLRTKQPEPTHIPTGPPTP